MYLLYSLAKFKPRNKCYLTSATIVEEHVWSVFLNFAGYKVVCSFLLGVYKEWGLVRAPSPTIWKVLFKVWVCALICKRPIFIQRVCTASPLPYSTHHYLLNWNTMGENMSSLRSFRLILNVSGMIMWRYRCMRLVVHEHGNLQVSDEALECKSIWSAWVVATFLWKVRNIWKIITCNSTREYKNKMRHNFHCEQVLPWRCQ